MNTKVLPNHTPILAGLEHPSLPGETIPAVLTGQPAQHHICWRCQWLATMIHAGRDVEAYAWLAIEHVEAQHSEWGRSRIRTDTLRSQGDGRPWLASTPHGALPIELSAPADSMPGGPQ